MCIIGITTETLEIFDREQTRTVLLMRTILESVDVGGRLIKIGLMQPPCGCESRAHVTGIRVSEDCGLKLRTCFTGLLDALS